MNIKSDSNMYLAYMSHNNSHFMIIFSLIHISIEFCCDACLLVKLKLDIEVIFLSKRGMDFIIVELCRTPQVLNKSLVKHDFTITSKNIHIGLPIHH
jgi:hypothetical protein